MTQKDQERIDEIMDCFDFEKVHRAMVALDWQWREEGVPELYQIKKTARELLKHVCVQTNFFDLFCSSTGGFIATRYKDGCLKLAFEISDWTTDEE